MLTAVRLTLSFLTPSERAKYVVLIAIRALTGLLDVAGIGLIAFIAAVAGSQFDASGSIDGGSIAGIEIPRVNADGLVWLVVAVLGVFIVKATIAILLMREQAHFVARVETRNALSIADYVLHGSLALAKRSSKAELQFALTGSSTYAFTGLLNNVASLICESFLLLVITATFFIVNPLVAVFALVYFAVVVLVIQVFIGRSLKRAGREAVSGTVETMNSISNTLDTFREISVLHKQALFIDRIATSRARIARSGATMTFLAGMPRYVVETALILGVVILVAQQFLSGELSSGLVTVGVFLAGGVRMMASLLPLQSAISNMKGNVEQAKVALELLVELRTAANQPGRRQTAHVEAPATTDALTLELSAVSYRYPGADVDTISDVSLSVAHGQYAALIGPSGAGKTTVVDLVLGLIDPARGTVRIGGMEPTLLRAAAPGLISYVPQKPGIVSGSIAENIALGVEPAEIDRALLAEVVDAAYLTDFIASLPDGVDTSVGAQGDALSGGQVQRIGLARALYSHPRVLASLAHPAAAMAAEVVPALPAAVHAVATGGVLAAPVLGGLSLGASTGAGALVGSLAIIAAIGGGVALGVTAPGSPLAESTTQQASASGSQTHATADILADSDSEGPDPSDPANIPPLGTVFGGTGLGSVLGGTVGGVVDGVGKTVDGTGNAVNGVVGGVTGVINDVTAPVLDPITGGAPALSTTVDLHLAGTGTPGATVTAQLAGAVSTAVVASNGTWNITINGLPLSTTGADATVTQKAGLLGGLLGGLLSPLTLNVNSLGLHITLL